MDSDKIDRPARDPGGVECNRCGETFVGEPWHMFCAICVKQVADEIAEKQGLRQPAHS